MMSGKIVKDWSQRLLDAGQKGRTEQTQALLSAFVKIDDAKFREEMIILLEIIASNPKLLARRKTTALIPDELAANVIRFNPAR